VTGARIQPAASDTSKKDRKEGKKADRGSDGESGMFFPYSTKSGNGWD